MVVMDQKVEMVVNGEKQVRILMEKVKVVLILVVMVDQQFVDRHLLLVVILLLKI